MKRFLSFLMLVSLALIATSCANNELFDENDAIEGGEIVLSLCPGGELIDVSYEALSKADLPAGTLYAVSVYYSTQKYAHGVFDDPSKMILKLSTGKEYSIQVKAVKEGVSEISHAASGGVQVYDGAGSLDNAFHYYATDTTDEAFYGNTSNIASLEDQWLLDTYYGALTVTPTSQTSNLTINLYRMMHAVDIRVAGLNAADGTVTFTQSSYLPGTAEVALSYSTPEYLKMAVINTDFAAVLSGITGQSDYSRTSVFSATYTSTLNGEPYSKTLIDSQSITFRRNRKSILTLTIDHNYLGVNATLSFVVEGGDMEVDESDFTGTIDTDASATVSIPEAVDLGLSVKWAACNLCETGFVSSPEKFGDYYAWGEIEPYYSSLESPVTWKDSKSAGFAWASYSLCDESYSDLTKYNTDTNFGAVDNKTVLEGTDDAAHAKLGGYWRMPTEAEWEALHSNCTWTWSSNYNSTGIGGMIVTSNIEGYKDKSIFLPAAGFRYSTYFTNSGSYCHYWSSVLGTSYPYLARGFTIGSSDFIGDNVNRCYGFSVRPVSE